MKEDAQKSRRAGQIDENLKRVFQQTLEEDIPERFRDLLTQLRNSERKVNGGADE